MTMPLFCSARRRVLATLAVAALPIFALIGASTPASAAVTQTGSCVDGGGNRWTGRAIWEKTYTDGGGNRRVQIDFAGWTTNRSGNVPTDSKVRTYDGDGKLIQTLTWSGSFDYKSGSSYRSRNPLNPGDAPGRAKVRVTLGIDGDGFGDCSITFTQPATTSPTPTPTPTPPAGSASDTYESNVVTATNKERTSRSLAALTPQQCVDSYAESQAAKMAAEKRMYHQDLGPILSGCGLRSVGENVAYGYASGTAVTTAWMNSSGHRANILNSSYTLLGVGAAQDSAGTWYAAQVFGSK